MGKNSKRPCGYSPWLELYLRRDKEGGKLLDPAVFHGLLPAALARRSCLVLVHGFNNSDGGAHRGGGWERPRFIAGEASQSRAGRLHRPLARGTRSAGDAAASQKART